MFNTEERIIRLAPPPAAAAAPDQKVRKCVLPCGFEKAYLTQSGYSMQLKHSSFALPSMETNLLAVDFDPLECFESIDMLLGKNEVSF